VPEHIPDEGVEMPQLPLLEAAAVSAQVELKPTWRGWIHAGTFPVAIAAGIVLIVLADGAAAKWAAAVFMATSVLLFGNSALYHRFNWGRRRRRCSSASTTRTSCC
jgi:hemolysin III